MPPFCFGKSIVSDDLNQWVDHTDQVTSKINLIERQVVDLETGVRGFIISRDPDFLEPYNRSLIDLPASIRDFRELVRDDARQEDRMDRVEALVSGWLRIQALVIQMVRSGRNPDPIVRSMAAKSIVDSIREEIGKIRSAEERLRAQRTASSQQRAAAFFWVLMGAFVFLSLVWILGLMAWVRTRRNLSVSETKFRTLAEAMPQIVWITDANGANTYFNQHWMDYTGLTLEESYGAGWNIPFHPDDRQRSWDAWVKAVETDGPYRLEARLRRADGVYRSWLISGASIHDETRRIVGWVGACTDVEDIKQIEDALRNSEAKYRGFLDSAQDAILIANKEGKITYINQQTASWFGYSREELVGRPIEVLVPERYRALHVGDRNAYIHDPKPRGMAERFGDLVGRRKDGTEFPVSISLSPSATPEGVLITAVIRDVSEAKRLSEQALLAREEAIATVSHDLKNPLAAIQTCIDFFSSRSAPSAQKDELMKRTLTTIDRASKQMGDLIQDLLEYAKLEVHRLKLETQLEDVASILSEVFQTFEPMAQAKSISMLLKRNREFDQILCERRRIVRVFSNLIGNAIKFTPPGGTVKIGVEDSDGEIVFSVQDTGTGIPPEQLPHVFERYWQADETARKGTGLGLAIAKGFVEAHGGRIWAESQIGRGSVFRFSMPRSQRMTASARGT